VEPFTGEGDGEEEESVSMDVYPEPMETGAQVWPKAEEENTTDAEVLGEDELEDVVDVAMIPMADILNARNGCDNVHPYI
jgi:hypothetical protein